MNITSRPRGPRQSSRVQVFPSTPGRLKAGAGAPKSQIGVSGAEAIFQGPGFSVDAGEAESRRRRAEIADWCFSTYHDGWPRFPNGQYIVFGWRLPCDMVVEIW
jgi:hypothetical protein